LEVNDLFLNEKNGAQVTQGQDVWTLSISSTTDITESQGEGKEIRHNNDNNFKRIVSRVTIYNL